MSGSIAPPTAPPPGAAPPPGGPPSQGQPPIGSSPATAPTQNLGLAAKGLQAVSALLNGMAMVIPLVGAHTPLGQEMAKSMVSIGKHVPPGAASPEGEKNFLAQMALKQQQMGPQKAAMASQMPPGAGPGGPSPGAGAPPPPMPPPGAPA